MQVQSIKSNVSQFELSNQIIDSDLFSKVKLTASARLVLIVLCRYYPNIYPCQNTISKKSGLSIRSVINALSELKSKGLILVECNHSNTYRFTLTFFELAEIADSTGKTCTKQRAEIAHNNTNYKNNKKSFNSKILSFQNQQGGIKYKSANETIKQIEKDKETAVTPLDFDKIQAVEYLNKLPEFAQNGFYAKELKKKWKLNQ